MNHRVMLVLNLYWGISTLFSIVAVPFYSFHKQRTMVPISPHFPLTFFFSKSHFNGCEWHLIVNLICIYLAECLLSPLHHFKSSYLFFLNLFLIEGILLYNIVLVSAIHQHESAIGIHMFPPSWTSPTCHPVSPL